MKCWTASGHIDLTPEYIRPLSEACASKPDEAKIIDSSSAEINYAFKANMLDQFEQLFDKIGTHLAQHDDGPGRNLPLSARP